MKIARLDLLAFGAFTGARLAFGSAPFGLHVVYGPNEAGKSTALRALRQMLYGIPHKPDGSEKIDFLHNYRDLRIGAVLEGADGQRLECIRRKAQKDSLRGADDETVLDPLQLAQMLHHLDEAAFCRRFAIDYDELVTGGRAIVEGGGDLGAILFSAGTGLADLRGVQEKLAEEAGALFKPSATRPRINAALAEIRQQREILKQSVLPTVQWKETDDQWKQAKDQRARLLGELSALETAHRRLQRIAEAWPLIERRERLEARLTELAGVPLLPGDFSERRRTLQADLRVARQTAADAQAEIAGLEPALAELVVPPALIAHAAAIARVYQGLGAHGKAVEDRTKLTLKIRAAEREIGDLLRELGRADQPAGAEPPAVDRVQRVRIQNLGNQQQGLAAQCEAAGQALARLERQLAQAQQQLAQLPPPRDAEPLRRAMRAAQQQGDLEDRLRAAQDELAHAQRQAEVDLRRLPLFDGLLEELESLPVPATETIDRFEGLLDGAAQTMRDLARARQEAEDEARRLDQQIERLRLRQDVPTEADLAQARQVRDAGWSLVRRAWLAESLPARSSAANTKDAAANGLAAEVAAFVASFPPAADLPQAYALSVEAADQVADRLRREAEQVAHKTNLIAQRQALELRTAQLAAQLDRAEAEQQTAQAQWCELWQPMKIVPHSPREMRAWLLKQAGLAAAVQTCRRQRQWIAQTEETLARRGDELRGALSDLSPSEPAAGLSLAEGITRAEHAMRSLDGAQQRREQLTAEVRDTQAALDEARRQQSEAAVRLARWSEQWGEAMQALGLSSAASPAEANAVLGALEQLAAKARERDDLTHRIAGIDRDAGAFLSQVRQLARQVEFSFDEDGAVERQVEDLYQQMSAVEKAQARREKLLEQLQRQRHKLREATSDAARLEDELKELCREAGCDAAEQLPAAEQRSTERQTALRSLSELEVRLSQLAAGVPVEQFIEQARSEDPQQVEQKNLQLAGEIQAQRDLGQKLSEEIGMLEGKLAQMDGSAAAALAQQTLQERLAQVRDDARQYARLRLASAVLHQAIQRYRERNQGPVVQSASRLFSRLTLGSFAGLRADYNEKGDPVLVGVRSGERGETVPVEGMSEGTCDQLYLSLRLASLEEHLKDHEPIPFVVDDVLIKFDDDRARAALQLLEQLAERTQVIFFTHHQHLVDLARETLAGDGLFTYDLDCRNGA